LCWVSRWSFGPISGVLGSRCRFGGKPVCLTADALCSSNLRVWVHLDSSDSRGCLFGDNALASAGGSSGLGRLPTAMVSAPRGYQSFGIGAAFAATPCHSVRCAMPPSRLRGAREGCLQSRRGRTDSSESKWRSISRVPSGSRLVGSLRGVGYRSGPFGGSATRVHFGGHVTRFGGSADSFGSQPPAESLRRRQRNPNSRATFGSHETRGDPTALVCARSRKELKAQGSIGHSSVATLARCNGFGDGSKP
jgi:hypothetical protein